jgi:murein DD-endopeptidase MepM/ murein hydrolase activator NlpD
MRKFSRIVSAVTFAALLALGGARAMADDLGCGSLLMPAAQLKTMSRGFSRYHSGVDLTAPYGSLVRAAAPGVVVFAGVYYGYGNMIDIRHDDGIVTRYAHLSKFAKGLHVGTPVALGEEIGNIGTSGHAHGAHLHFEVRIDGHAVDPAPFLALAACPAGSGAALEEAHAPDLPVQPDRPSPAAH